ncbi:MAG: hypothetical protein RSD49_21005 [Hafnia sp.]
MIDKDGLKNVLTSLFAGIDDGNKDAFEQVKHLEPIQKAGIAVQKFNPDKFYFALIYPLSNMVDGLLSTYTPSEEAKFLFKHHGFVESHFEHHLGQIEGRACVADKTRTIIRHLCKALITGEVVEFDYTQEYTYHLPKKIFTQQAGNLAFFNSLVHLYYGNPQKYIQELQNLTAPKADTQATSTGESKA